LGFILDRNAFELANMTTGAQVRDHVGRDPLFRMFVRNLDGVDAPGSVFLAGGAVRNCLLEGAPVRKDYDFFLSVACKNRIVSELEKAGKLTIGPFGSYRWFPNGDGDYVDIIAIEEFNNGVGLCRSMSDALRQFDITVNAIALNLATGEILDPLGGSSDCERRVLRAIRFDFPEEPIHPFVPLTRPEVLWFRLVHYGHVLGLSAEAETREWLLANSRHSAAADLFEKWFFPVDRKAVEKWL
jgi:hypothetical protein